jgi:hypothetical protein
MNDRFESNYGLLVRSKQKGRSVLEALTGKLWGNANSRMEMSANPTQDVYEIRPREERDGFDLIGDWLQDGPIWYAGPDAVRRAVAYAKYRSRSRSHRAIIRVFYEAGNVLETHEHAGDFKEAS